MDPPTGLQARNQQLTTFRSFHAMVAFVDWQTTSHSPAALPSSRSIIVGLLSGCTLFINLAASSLPWLKRVRYVMFKARYLMCQRNRRKRR